MDLPTDILARCFTFLPLNDIGLSAALVCKQWHEASNDELLWQALCIAESPYLLSEPVEQWQQYYRENLTLIKFDPPVISKDVLKRFKPDTDDKWGCRTAKDLVFSQDNRSVVFHEETPTSYATNECNFYGNRHFTRGIHTWSLKYTRCASGNTMIGIAQQRQYIRPVTAIESDIYLCIGSSTIWVESNESKYRVRPFITPKSIITLQLNCDQQTLKFYHNGYLQATLTLNSSEWWPAFNIYNGGDDLTLVQNPSVLHEERDPQVSDDNDENDEEDEDEE